MRRQSVDYVMYDMQDRITACHRVISESFPFKLLVLKENPTRRKPQMGQGGITSTGNGTIIAFALPAVKGEMIFLL